MHSRAIRNVGFVFSIGMDSVIIITYDCSVMSGNSGWPREKCKLGAYKRLKATKCESQSRKIHLKVCKDAINSTRRKLPFYWRSSFFKYILLYLLSTGYTPCPGFTCEPGSFRCENRDSFRVASSYHPFCNIIREEHCADGF